MVTREDILRTAGDLITGDRQRTYGSAKASHATIAGMLSGLIFTASYIIFFKFIAPEFNTAEYWWLGVSPEGIGTLGMILNFLVSFIVMQMTPPPPQEVQDMVRNIRIPR